jgi:ribonuclease HII
MKDKLNSIGVDEVGRGCLSGPVVACALMLNKNTPKGILDQIKDSKTLSIKKREYIANLIEPYAIYSIKSIEANIIDKINILQASLLAMYLATIDLIKKSNNSFNYPIIIDGNKNFNYLAQKNLEIIENSVNYINLNSTAIIKADAKIINVSAASIIAKNFRDKLMINLSKTYPYYMWDKNFGYGTKDHLIALKHYGITIHHRASFQPVSSVLKNKQDQIT